MVLQKENQKLSKLLKVVDSCKHYHNCTIMAVTIMMHQYFDVSLHPYIHLSHQEQNKIYKKKIVFSILCPLLIFSQSDYLMQIVAIDSHI